MPKLELLPAVDVRDGQAVRLVHGESGSETSYGSPLQAALAWQRSGAEFVLYGKQVLVADDPGAGKTATAIRGLARLQELHTAGHELGEPVFPILVVCPNSMKLT